ncbi:hypothetical protein LSM04_006224 [Trypanosoma melophagium]|nr:hypothetical protein LSM04_006224 [Trypanosoma melophagium]
MGDLPDMEVGLSPDAFLCEVAPFLEDHTAGERDAAVICHSISAARDDVASVYSHSSDSWNCGTCVLLVEGVKKLQEKVVSQSNIIKGYVECQESLVQSFNDRVRLLECDVENMREELRRRGVDEE